MCRYGVIGNPIVHSMAPYVYAEFARQTGQEISYTKFLSTEEKFLDDLQKFYLSGGLGLNVTAPFKQMASKFVQVLSHRAKYLEAINVISFSNNITYGDNTDGIGFIKDLKINNHYMPRAKKVLFLGAGGAVKGIMPELLLEEPKEITIVDINLENIRQLADKFKCYKNINIITYSSLKNTGFDLIINATSASMQKKLPPIPECISLKDSWCYDLVYDEVPTVFLEWAKAKGATNCIDGTGMLVEALASSFFVWTKTKPNTGEVLLKLKTKQKKQSIYGD